MSLRGKQARVSELEVFIFYFSKVGKNNWKIPEGRRNKESKKHARL
jgi:hypothetical protein